MKKILMATSALAVMTASSAFALDVKTSGGVEYKYSKTSENSKSQNPKLSQGGANIKMAASGASNGLAYGAWVNIKSATSTTHSTSASGADRYGGDAGGSAGGTQDKANDRELRDFKGLSAHGKKLSKSDIKASHDVEGGSSNNAAKLGGKLVQWRKLGMTQDGKNVYQQVLIQGNANAASGTPRDAGADIDKGDKVEHADSATDGKYTIIGYQIGGDQPKHDSTNDVLAKDQASGSNPNSATYGSGSGNSKTSKATASSKQTLANNAVTQSAFWLSGQWGKFTIGQSGSAAGDNAISGAVSAASFTTGTEVAKPSADQTQGERYTYTAPTLVDGLTVAYTSSFKGNVDTAKTSKAKASTNWAVKYSTEMNGVAISVAHAEGTTSKTGDTKTQTNTQTGMTLGYMNFTVGYGMFENSKKAHQTKATSGSAYGVKYAMGDWAVGYTVKNSEDSNVYVTHSNKSASTSAYSVKYQIADGFSAYASKSNNSVKSTSGTSKKNNYTVIGAKISF